MFSNFYHAPFKVENTVYQTSEQYYQSKKGEHFHDDISTRKILLQSDPLECMTMGQRIKGFKESEWLKVDRKYMMEGNMAKFSQNPMLKAALLATGEKTLAESSAKDAYKGTGKSFHNKTAFSDWHGLNHHGKGLMLIRQRLHEA